MIDVNDFFLYSVIIAEGLAAIAGIAYWKKWKHSKFKHYIFYLIIISISQITCGILLFINDAWYDKIIIPFRDYVLAPYIYFFFTWFYYSFFNARQKQVIIYSSIILILIFAIESIFISNVPKQKILNSNFLMQVMIMIYSIMYLYTLINSDQILNYKTDPVFYCSILSFLTYSTVSFWCLLNPLITNELTYIGDYYYKTIIIVGILVYILYAVVIIKVKPK